MTSAEASKSESDVSKISTNPSTSWVAKRDRHIQLINSSVYNNQGPERLLTTQPTKVHTNDTEQVGTKHSVHNAFNSAGHPCVSASTYTANQVSNSRVSGGRNFKVGNAESQYARTSSEYLFLKMSWNMVHRFTHFLKEMLMYSIRARRSTFETHPTTSIAYTRTGSPSKSLTLSIRAGSRRMFGCGGISLTDQRVMLGPKKTNERCKRFALTGIFSILAKLTTSANQTHELC